MFHCCPFCISFTTNYILNSAFCLYTCRPASTIEVNFFSLLFFFKTNIKKTDRRSRMNYHCCCRNYCYCQLTMNSLVHSRTLQNLIILFLILPWIPRYTSHYHFNCWSRSYIYCLEVIHKTQKKQIVGLRRGSPTTNFFSSLMTEELRMPYPIPLLVLSWIPRLITNY